MTTKVWPDNDLLTTSHTGILTTLRRDGRPVSLPVWFVAKDEVIYVRAQADSAKVKRITADPRCSFLVESGEHFSDLHFAHVAGEASVIKDADTRAAMLGLMADKYRGSVEGGGPASLPDPGPNRVALIQIRPTGGALSR